jgi:deoxyribodipyrimidine photo-lyase
MTATRRPSHNFALEHAAGLARDLRKPLLVLEALRVDYPHASDRLHSFILDGMAANAASFAGAGALYYPYVEPAVGAGKGLLAALAERSCCAVTDDFPAFFLPRAAAAAAASVTVRLESVDSAGLLPMAATDRAFPTAHSFRRHLQKKLHEHLASLPAPDPLADGLPGGSTIPADITSRWPAASPGALRGDTLADLPIDHAVSPIERRGGFEAARHRALEFIEARLQGYTEGRNHPDEDATSGLSPYLHFGHISTHEVFARIAEREDWSPSRISGDTSGSRAGWWGMSPSAEAFLDQLVTWRELGYNFCRHRTDYAVFESLPDWARETLQSHASDPRELYTLQQLESAGTDDPVWNAAQRQLLREGVIHNYLRMLWGKRILEWSPSPREAAERMVHLNDKYAIDGRDPNSYSGIFWCLGRYDRPWGPERPIFGKVRYMSSANTVRKLRMQEYLHRYG